LWQAWDEHGSISFCAAELPPALRRQVLKALDGLVPAALLRRRYHFPSAAAPLLQAVVTQLTHPGVSLAGHLAGVLGAASLMAGWRLLALSAPAHAALWMLGHAALAHPRPASPRPPPAWGAAYARLARSVARLAAHARARAAGAALAAAEALGRLLRLGARPGGGSGPQDGRAGWRPAVGERVRLVGLAGRRELNGQVAVRGAGAAAAGG
jgi:hypothetical protein